MVRVYEHTSIKLHDGRMRAPSSQNRIERNSNLVLILFRAPLSLSLALAILIASTNNGMAVTRLIVFTFNIVSRLGNVRDVAGALAVSRLRNPTRN